MQHVQTIKNRERTKLLLKKTGTNKSIQQSEAQNKTICTLRDSNLGYNLSRSIF